MYADPTLIRAVAQFIVSGLDSLPKDDAIEWNNLDDFDAQIFRDLLDELAVSDLCRALELAAERLPEPSDEDDETNGGDPA
jgi:hypothetical protein